MLWGVLIAMGIVGSLAGRERHAPPPKGAHEVKSGEDAIAAQQERWIGFALNCHHIGDLPRYLRSVDAIAAMGANALIIVTPWYQERVDSVEIGHDAERCPTDEQLRAILHRARAHGLRTALMPIVLLKETDDEKEWRGVIRPRDWDAWWASYEGFIGHFLSLAREAKVDLFFIGSELNSTEGDITRWQAITKMAREQFDGQLSYSANWDRYEQVTFWRMLDVMAVSSYFELESANEPGDVESLMEVWRGARDGLLSASARYDRPVLLSEVGYPSLSTGAAYPWNYTSSSGGRFDPDTQARAWQAFINAWDGVMASNDARFAGFFGYRWDPYYAGQRNDRGYGVRGKPAHELLRNAFGRWTARGKDGAN